MFLFRPSAVLLCGTLALAGVVSAEDKPSEEGIEEKVEEIVEERAAEEASDGEPADADVGEASYNVENCDPATSDGDAEGADDGADAEAAAESDEDADAVGDEVEQKDMDDCVPVTK